MQDKNLLWEYIPRKSNSFKQILDLCIEFIVAHLTILSFISLTGILSSKFEWFGSAIVLMIAVIAYLVLSEVFIVFFARYNLSYGVSMAGIHFKWGFFNSRQVFIPYEEIEYITVIDRPELKRKAIEFRTSTNLTNGSLGIEIGALSYILSFEGLLDIAPVLKILRKEFKGHILDKSVQKPKGIFYRFSKSPIYHKLNLFLAFSFIYVATFIAMAIFDNNFATQDYIEDLVVEETIGKGNFYFENKMLTANGHEINLVSHNRYLNDTVRFWSSPVYKYTSRFDSFKAPTLERVNNGYVSDNLAIKVICFLVLVFFAGYIIYKRGNLFRDDYIMMIFGPILVTLVIGFYLFH